MTWIFEIILDSSNVTVSPDSNFLEFKYTISISVEDVRVTNWAIEPLFAPIILSPRMEFVSKFNPETKVNLSKIGCELFKDS